jgi:hypothetical protein
MKPKFVAESMSEDHPAVGVGRVYPAGKLSLTELHAIVSGGSFFTPAWKHYAPKYTRVSCDHCGAKDLSACVGMGMEDICLACAQAHADFVEKDYCNIQGLTVEDARRRLAQVGLVLEAVDPYAGSDDVYRVNRTCVHAVTDVSVKHIDHVLGIHH